MTFKRGIKDTNYDVLIIGGGITGAAVLMELTLRGLRCILIDKGDFSSGTSSKSSKLIHGGLRYLKYGKFALVFNSCVERYFLLKYIAPHLVKPLHFIIPVFSLWDKFLYFFGVLLYKILSIFHSVGGIKFYSPFEIKTIFPGIKNSKGAIGYFDCKALDYRLVIDTLKSAYEEGASLLNYCKLQFVEVLPQSYELGIKDELNGDVYKIWVKVIVNATGPWADEVLESLGSRKFFNLKRTSGINLILKIPDFVLNYAVAFESIRDKRNLFAIPWDEYILLGTTDKVVNSPDSVAKVDDINYLLESFSYYFPQLKVNKSNIHSLFVGVRPLMGSDKDVPEEKLSRDFSIIFDGRIVSITGGKLTTHRHMAKILSDKIIKRFFPFNKKLYANKSIKPISGSSIIKSNIQKDSLSKRLYKLYGSNAELIFKYIELDSSLSEPFCPCCPVIKAEVSYLVEKEFVQKLSDVFMRRTELFLFGKDNGLHLLEPVSAFLGDKLGWTEERRIKEVNEYRKDIFKMREVISAL